ncbi:endopeptidase La [Candidatus Parcubacteria bacterium]|nr:MAG: endopeptidase La [Candidatus Parcubacteria bacterium]
MNRFTDIFKPENPNAYPAVALRKAVIFPSEKTPIVIEGKEVVATLKKAIDGGRPIVMIFRKNGEESSIGVMCNLLQYWDIAPMTMGMIIEGVKRVKVLRVYSEDDARIAEVGEAEESGKEEDPFELEALARNVFDQLKSLFEMQGIVPILFASELGKEYLPPDKTSDIAAAALKMDFRDKLELIETLDLKKRLKILNAKVAKELNIIQAERKIQKEVAREVGKAQRDFILQERLKAIEKELGIYEDQKEYAELENKIRKSALPKDVESKAMKELHRLKKMSPSSAEAPYIQNYLDWIVELPWNKKSKAVLDLKKAKEILDSDHYGLEKAKERVLEYLAVQKISEGKNKGNILCFAGPPGTGKTSVGKSIAKALGRNFVRMSLGGVRDEAEIRGHRRTYVGALPGRIIQAMKTAGTKNPVFMLDEIDKVGADFRGDPSAALLEVLDPEQNYAFSDHYLEAPFDLSDVFFITTANILDPIPPALRDRIEVIEFSGYTDEEKFNIAKKFIIPKVMEHHGLDKESLKIDDGVIRKIISKYTREAGVRNLERKIAEIARKIARQIVEGHPPETIVDDILPKYLGPEEFERTMREASDEVGIATGLAWTPAGGEIMFVEANLTPGKGNLLLTGQLGEVMKESAKAAISYIRSRSDQLGFDPAFYYKSDIHVHVPSGAIAKDGPSAGIAIATAIASILTKRKVRKEVALTGEITLSGKVLPIGGVKEKVLAAHRAGVETIVLPKENEKNIAEVPEEVRKTLQFKAVKNVDEALGVALI